eukprot:TRINITY_DN8926_c0_g1_i1.p1 TRINITY_DN8926_c0_g1~~TRINITY_DN8926_c0_g1_i1.p1  ORF type:complete len:304 (-),score=87.84 TRINITY_DN8926_c0_g1_i1:303-1214(-)
MEDRHIQSSGVRAAPISIADANENSEVQRNGRLSQEGDSRCAGNTSNALPLQAPQGRARLADLAQAFKADCDEDRLPLKSSWPPATKQPKMLDKRLKAKEGSRFEQRVLVDSYPAPNSDSKLDVVRSLGAFLGMQEGFKTADVRLEQEECTPAWEWLEEHDEDVEQLPGLPSLGKAYREANTLRLQGGHGLVQPMATDVQERGPSRGKAPKFRSEEAFRRAKIDSEDEVYVQPEDVLGATGAARVLAEEAVTKYWCGCKPEQPKCCQVQQQQVFSLEVEPMRGDRGDWTAHRDPSCKVLQLQL